jgi:hypothetical protein
MTSKSATTHVEFDENLHIKPIKFAEELGIRPQMVYNYIANDRFPEGTVVEVTHVEKDEEGEVTKTRSQNVLDRAKATEWAEEYTARKEARAAKAQQQLEDELAGKGNKA